MTVQAKFLMCAVAISGLAAFAAVSPAQALSSHDCSVKYQAAKAAGTLNGQIFLVVDLDGNGVYSAGHDLVIHLASPIGTMASTDFI